MRKYWVSVSLLFGMVLLLASIPTNLPGKIELFSKNPLLLSLRNLDGSPAYVGQVFQLNGRTFDPGPGKDIWSCSEPGIGGPDTYPFQSAPFTLYASSNSASDTGQIVEVIGLDDGWERQVSLVILDGQNFVQVGGSLGWIRVLKAVNLSGTPLAGDVYLGLDATGALGVPANVGTTLQSCISQGDENSMMSIYTTGDDEETWILQSCVSAWDESAGQPGYASVRTQIRRNLLATSTFRTADVVGVGVNGNSNRCDTFLPPRHLLKRTDFKLRMETATVDKISTTFDFIVIKD